MVVALSVTFGVLGVILLIIIILATLRLLHVGFAKEYESAKSFTGKTVIITGTTAGIGKAAAFDFANRGARVIMGCRNVTKAQIIADEIASATSNSNIIVHYLDTSILASAREFSLKILETEERIDVIILNAGITGDREYKQTEDKIELTMATNHFGHFLIINLLLGLIVESAPSKIICISSRMHLAIRNLDIENLVIRKENFKFSYPYGLSKLCNITTARYLAPILQKHGVTINSMCPGLVSTEIFTKGTAWFTATFLGLLTNILARSPKQGIATLLYLAMDVQVIDETGKFFVDFKEGISSPLSKDNQIIRKIWKKSEKIVGLTEQELSVLRRL